MKCFYVGLTLGILIAISLHPPAFGQPADEAIVIEVKDSGSDPPAPVTTYLNGYRSALSGETFQYHSSDPDVDTALLVRGQTATHVISWETDPLTASPNGYAQFIWLAGIESAGFETETDVHTWDFLINGQHWFTFRNAKDSSALNWKVAGKDGAELSFATVVHDKFGDLFGYMVLKAPSSAFPAGQPLSLEIRGDNSGSADWYMTFQHRFNFVPQVRAEPALVKDGSRAAQVLRVSLDNLAEGRSIEIRAADHDPVKSELKVGANVLRLPIAAVSSNLTLPVRFQMNGKLIETMSVLATPVKKRDIYLLSYSHNDIGYTDLQPDVERKQWHNLEQALKLIRDTQNYPADARYKWNMETIWALESYLRQAAPAQRGEVLSRVHDGSLGLSALYANMLTGLANSVEMSHYFDYARQLRSEQQFPMTAAVTSDVPGFSWGMVSAMAHSGVKYFATAPNAGDRIGYALQTWGDKPFYWTSQSGRERVLMWMAGASYSAFHEGSLSQLGDEKIMKLVRKLDEASYPYDMVQLPYTIGDNGPPDPTLPDFVRQWNERYVTPRLILATHEQMFREFERRYGASLPEFRGDFTPYWEDGAVSSAYETALSRAASDRLIQGEALWSMISPGAYPAAEFASAWRNVAFFDEHTWGAHNSTEEPDLPFVKQQWEFKRKFALDADRASRELLKKVLPVSDNTGMDLSAIDVYNTNSWPRTDVVFLAPEMSTGRDLVEAGGHPIPSQRLRTGELAVLVEDLPPFSAVRLLLKKGTAYSRASLKVEPQTLENEFVALSVNQTTGAIDSLRWKKNGTELVDKTRGAGLNEYLYVLGTNADKAQRLSNVRVRIKEQGNLVASLLIEADAPGEKSYSTEIRLIEGIDRVDLITNLDKRAVREKEGVHVAFPFAVPEGQLRYDVANGIVRPESDQLAGACKNFFSVQSWVDVSNNDYGIIWATANAPLVEIGAITAEQPWMKSIAPSSGIYSYVMNNYWHTNYKADQEGPMTFTYSLRPHAAFRPSDAAKFGVERRQPLIVAAADPSALPPPSLLNVSSPDVMVSSLKPLGSGNSWLAYLYNPTAKPQVINLQWNRSSPASIHQSDAAGTDGAPVGNFEMPAFASGYLRIDQDGGTK